MENAEKMLRAVTLKIVLSPFNVNWKHFLCYQQFQNLSWRQQYQVDTLLDRDQYESPEVLKLYLPGGMIGWDRYNNPRKLKK